MIAQKLHAAGFTDLVSVMPPDAKLYATSRIDPSQRGKCPGLKTPGGWVGYRFTQERTAPETIDAWGANVGLLGNRFPGLDIDVDDPALARAIEAQAFNFLTSPSFRSNR